MHYPVAIPTPITRREVTQFIGWCVVGCLVCLFAPVGICCWLLRRLWRLPLTTWLRHQVRLTAQDLYTDRWEMAAYLFVLAIFAFFLFTYIHQPQP